MVPVCINIDDATTLYVTQTHKFKRNVLTFSYIIPISPTTTPQDVLLPSVLLRGTEKYPTYAKLSIACDELYGATLDYSYSYIGDNIMITFTAVFVDDNAVDTGDYILNGVISLLTEIWLHPALDNNGRLRADDVQKCKATLIDSIRSANNDAATYAYQKCREIMCMNEPYGYSVNESEIKAIDEDILTRRYRELRNCCDVFFAYVGAASAETVCKKIREKFTMSHKSIIMANCLEQRQPSGSIQKSERHMPVTQSQLVMGFDAGGAIISHNNDYYSMLVANEVFGASPNSRLFRHIREEKGLCYYCGSFYNKYKGIIYVNAGIDASNKENVRSEVFRQLSELQEGHLCEAEIETAKRSLVHSAKQILDRPLSIIGFYVPRFIFQINCSLEEHIAKINDITFKQVVTAFNKINVEAEYFLVGDLGSENICEI